MLMLVLGDLRRVVYRSRTWWVAVSSALLAVAACAPASDQEFAPRPDVLLIFVDDLNTDLQSFGSQMPVGPNIDRIAERGVTFTRAYAQYPQCNQSRASILTGLYPEQISVLSLKDHFRDTTSDVVTLPQHFRSNGYFAARVGKVFHQGVPNEIGEDGLDDPLSWDLKINPKGKETLLDSSVNTIVPDGEDRPGLGGLLSWLAVPGSGTDMTDVLVADSAIEIMRRHRVAKPEQPMFLAVGFYRPHTPFIAPQSFFEDIPRNLIELPVTTPADRANKPVMALADRPYQLEMSAELKNDAAQAYYAAANFVDEQIGRLLDELVSQGRLENTVVVFLSDHGYQLGAHGLWQKGDLFEGSTRTPLVISAPAISRAGERHSSPVELVDVYPTIVALAGLDRPTGPLSGTRLLGQSGNGVDRNDTAYSVAWSRAGWTRPEFRGREVIGRTIRSSRYRYTEWGDGPDGIELYDYDADPEERQNLAGDPDHAAVENRMRSLLRQARTRAHASLVRERS